MASSRKPGTNEVISTYKETGGDYTDLGAWETAVDGNMVTGTKTEVLECYDRTPHARYDDTVLFNGSTTNSSYHLIIRAATGERHTGVSDTGVGFRQTTDAYTIDARDDFIKIYDLDLSQNINSTVNRASVYFRNNGCTCVGCLYDDGVNSGSGQEIAYIHAAGAGVDTYWINCMARISDNTWRGCFWNSAGDPVNGPVIYNCTIESLDQDAYYFGADYALIKNSIGMVPNSTQDVFAFPAGVSSSSATCASNQPDESLPGTGHRYSQTFSFVNAAGGDYHLQSTDAGAKDFGTDLSADTVYDFDDDIDGDVRTGSWDIGFDEVVSAAVGSLIWKPNALRTHLTR